MTEILIGSLSLKSVDERKSLLVEKINEAIRPPRDATVENVNIRAMYVVNDLVNSHGGRFRREDLENLRGLILDTPVLIGHNRAETPLARTFHAELEDRGEVTWLKSYFYWPKEADGAKDELLVKIDSGILKECSIAFVYTFPECSICGEDFRSCPHDIQRTGDLANGAHFIYSGITQVLETSLVYRGSVKGTYVTDRLSILGEPKIVLAADGAQKQLTIDYGALGRNVTIIPIDTEHVTNLRIISKPEQIAAAIGSRQGRQYLMLKRRPVFTADI